MLSILSVGDHTAEFLFFFFGLSVFETGPDPQ